MCLGVPGKIVELYLDRGLRMAKVDFGGAFAEACMETLPDAEVGQYTIIHAGFAISVLSQADALETLELLRQMSMLGDELGEGVLSESAPGEVSPGEVSPQV